MGSVIDGFPTDLSLREDFTFPGEATRFPVETGADFTDHIRELPDEITLECLVSDTPSGAIASDPTRQRDGEASPLPSADALLKLREMKRARRAVTIQTSLGTFENMACIEINVSKDKDREGGLFFTARFQHIEVKTNKRTRVRVATPMAGAGGKPKVQKKAVDEVVVNARMLWRMAQPPGGALKYEIVTTPAGPSRHFIGEWAIVEAVKTRRPTTRHVLGVDVATAGPLELVYRYTGEASTRVQFRIVIGKELTDSELEAFFLDRARDRDEERAARLRELQGDPSLNAKPANLPDDVSIKRFKRGAPRAPSTRGL